MNRSAGNGHQPTAGEGHTARLAIPLPGRAQALHAKNAQGAPRPARTAAADLPGRAAGSAAMRSPATAPAPVTTNRPEGKPWTSPITTG
jgi:hypothetical protein